MIRKDFEMIASHIQGGIEYERSLDGAGLLALEALARGLANDLEDTNPHFDRVRFLKAAGVEG
jgi:hypothetical protein